VPQAAVIQAFSTGVKPEVRHQSHIGYEFKLQKNQPAFL
jgi:hypothetical protein